MTANTARVREMPVCDVRVPRQKRKFKRGALAIFAVSFPTTGTRSRCRGNIDNILCGMAYRRKFSPETQLHLLVSVVVYIVVVELLTYAPYWFHA